MPERPSDCQQAGAYPGGEPMCIAMLLCFAPLLFAQGGRAPWDELRSKNPPGIAISLRLINPHPFHQGELIAAELNLPDYSPVRTPPLAEHWQFGGLLLDPPLDCGTVAKPCFLGAGGPGGMDFSGLMNGPQG